MTLGNTPAGDDMSSLAQGTAGGGAGGSITAGGGGDVNGRFFVVPSSNNSNNNNIIRPNQTQPQPQTQPPMAAMTGISHTQIDDEFDQELGGNIGKPKKSGLWASLGARGPSRTVTGATSFDNAAGNSVQPTVITSRGALQPDAVAAATATSGSGRPPAVSSRDLPLPDDTYDDTFKQLVTKNRSSRRLRPYRKRWRRVIIISVLSLCFIAFALTIGIYFGIKQREAQVRGNSGATTQSTPSSNMCCSRDQVTCAEDLRNLCSNEQTCTTTCEAFWITPSSSDGGSPSSPSTTAGCCSLDGGRTCEGGGAGVNNNYYGGNTNNNEEEGTVNNNNYYGSTINNNEEEGGVSSSSYYYSGAGTNNYNNATLSQLCNSNQQSCETNGECLGGAWIPYCCSTDGQYCDFTDTQPQCDMDSNTCTSTTCGGIAYGPYQSILKKGGCCSYDGGVTCGTVRDGKAQQCDMVAEECHSLCRGVYKSTKEDGCCSRDFGMTCDSSLKITTKNNNNRLPDFCDESQASCELTCGGTFKLPIPEFVTQQSNTTTTTTTTAPPTPAPVPVPSPPTPTAVDLTQQIKSLLVDSGVSLGNEQALERDNITGLALTPQSRALQWLSTADTYTKGLINLLPDNSGASLVLSGAPTEVNQTLVQRFGLALLFFSTTNLPRQSWSSAQGWLSPTNHCTWYGVTCGDGTGAGNSTATSSVGRQASLEAFQPVTKLSLGGNNLSSQDALEHPELFRSLGDTLVTLDLRDNSIGGRFGGSTEHEGALEYLKQLQTLSLFNNSIEGTISTYLGSLSNLEKIYMENNQLEGSLPTQIGNLMNLKRMDLYNNKLVGSLPKEIGMLTNLQRLWLSNNLFDSTLPQELSNCQSLQALYLDQNNFVGSIPSYLFTNLINLEDVRMYQNQFNGTIPPFSGQLTKLQLFYLDNNLLSGPLPRDYPASLKELSLYNNSLEGSIPSTLGRQPTNLQVLALSMNKLNSTIPTEFSFLENLNVLHLYNNSLQGELPQQFPSNIRDLFLQQNSLQGTIPQYIYNYTKVNLSNNNFSGNLPTPVGTNLQIQSLNVERNPRLGNNGAPIPSEVCSTTQLPNLRTVTVSCTNSIAGFNGGGGSGGGFTITQLQPCVTCA